MSSFRIQKSETKLCIHCSAKCPQYTLKCLRCHLWTFGTHYERIPKSNRLYNIQNVYVINLKKDGDRMISFFNNIKRQKISTKNRNWNRFNAVNGMDSKTITSEICTFLEDNKTKQKAIKYCDKYPGSIGCYFSHMKLWNHIYTNKNTGEYSLILEDDSFFTPNGMINIELALNQAIKLKWDMLYAGHNLLKGSKINSLFLKPRPPLPGENNIGFNSGLFGYIIRKSSIPKMLNIVKKIDSPFIDVQIRNSFGDGDENINALFTISNLIRHNNSYGSSRKKMDNYIK
mgnify:CR=1 FL=1